MHFHCIINNSISPDLKRLLWRYNTDAHVSDIDGTHSHPLYPGRVYPFFWSQDGKTIAVINQNKSLTKSKITFTNTESGKMVRQDEAPALEPAWSSNEGRLSSDLSHLLATEVDPLNTRMIWDNEAMIVMPVNKSRNLLKSQANFFSLCDYSITPALKLLNARKIPLLENEGLISSRLSPDGNELFYITGQSTQNLLLERLYRLIHFHPKATETFRRNWYVYNLKQGVRKLGIIEP